MRDLLVKQLEYAGYRIDRTYDFHPHIAEVDDELPPAGEKFMVDVISVITSIDGVKHIADQLRLNGQR